MQSVSGYDIDILRQEAQTRWLKPPEVLFILQNHEKYQLTHEAPQKPTSGSLFLFNKRVLRFFRRDGHNWRKKKDGRTVGEAHERLKVGNVEALNCYYAHGDQNNFQRRCYWMLDQAHEHIVLVHYREINELQVKTSSSNSQLSPGGSSNFAESPSSYTSQNLGSTAIINDLYEPYQNLSSPGSVEVNSEINIKSNGMDHLDVVRTGEFSSTAKLEVTQALKRLEVQLSLNEDSLEEISPFFSQDGNSNYFGVLEKGKETFKQDQYAVENGKETFKQDQYTGLLHGSEYIVHDKYYGGHIGMQDNIKNLVMLQDSGVNGENQQEHKYMDGCTDPFYWNEILDSSASILLPQEIKDVNFPTYAVEAHESNPGYFTMLNQIEMPIESNSGLTIAQRQKFTIQEISPEWGYTTEVTKVIIIGSFLCDPLDSAWTCMFGGIEVPLQIIREGVICCEAPPHHPGKVTLCITSGNRESCSEIREFEYRVKVPSCTHCSLSQTDSKNPEELLLLVRFVQLLLSDLSMQKGDNAESGNHLLRNWKANDDSWGHVIEALLLGSGTSSGITNWLLEELLKDKLQKWLSSRSSEGSNQPSCSLSKNEQGIIHMVAGLGFEWALNPILIYGVSIDFRDINGWTALHWAARFGREKMVAALIASGASAGAVTDPSSQDPTGRTPASIASISGHKGLAGYLSEVALTSHLSSLTLEESELSKGSAAVEAEIKVNNISTGSLATNEDPVSLKDTLAAVRNAAQAAARIQSAFRAHSFRKRRQNEVTATPTGMDEYGITLDEIQGISAMSKVAFRNARDYHSAALSIQKKYRGWKGRKDFLALRQKIVKIQAHVRGYQVRKQYKVTWAVGILDKVVLRWRRKGVGLRGFRQETESIDESQDEDILKVFRKQKVDLAIDEALSRVLSMVESPEARQQYSRMLERYRQAKADLGVKSEAETSTSSGAVSEMENDYMFQF